MNGIAPSFLPKILTTGVKECIIEYGINDCVACATEWRIL